MWQTDYHWDKLVMGTILYWSRVFEGLRISIWHVCRVTALMYTENEGDAAAFKEVLLRWQAKGNDKNRDKGPDLIQIGKKK